jgi:DNA-binding CsgD family transcriptional regulator
MRASQYRAFQNEAVAQYEARGVARQTEIAEVERVLGEGNSVVLAGHPGIGKSFVATRIAERLSAPEGESTATTVVRCSRPRDIRDLLENGVAAGDSVLLIEDAHLLSTDDLRALVVIASTSEQPLLITLDVSPVEGRDSAAVERSRLLTSLWTDLRLKRVDLSGIGFSEASSIIEAVSEGGVDVVTRARIVRAAAGNPRLVEELTREAVYNGGRVGDDQIALVLGPVVQTPRIVEFARAQLAGLSDAEEYALVSLAKIGRVSYVRAARLVGRSAMQSLVRRNLVTREPGSAEMVSAHVLYATAAHADRTTESPLESAHTIERALLEEHRGGYRLSSAECVVVAAAWTDSADLDPLEAVAPEDAAQIFARAARRADIWGVSSAGELFARHSLAIAPSAMATEQLSRALAGQGDYVGAIELLEGDDSEHDNADDDANLLAWWMTLLAWLDFDDDRWARLVTKVRRWGTVDRALDEWTEFEGYRRRLVGSTYDDGIAEMERFAAREDGSPSMRLRALRELLPAYSITGRTSDLQRTAETGRGIIANLATTMPIQVSGDIHAAAATFLAQNGLARVLIGTDRSGLGSDLNSHALRAVLSGNEIELAMANFISGYLMLSVGNPAQAERELARAESAITRKLEPRWAAVVRILRATALYELNRPEDARVIADAVMENDASLSPWIEYHKWHLDAWSHVAAGDLVQARATCIGLVEFAGPVSRQVAMGALHGAYQMGEPLERVVELAAAIPAEGSSDIADALEAYLRAELDVDAHRLDEIAGWFERLAMPWQAAIALRSAQQIHLRKAHPIESTASRNRADALERGVKIVVPDSAVPTTPSSTAAGQQLGKASTLTRRELEVARLAGAGLSNAEIANRLFLSVRTVESHVLQARAKLGAARRSELGMYLLDLVGQS